MTKTEFMLVWSRQRLSTLTVSPTLASNDFPVIKVSSAKLLGVTVDDNLDWGSHIRNIIKKVSSGIGAMKGVRHLIPQATLHLIYRALLLPQFNYYLLLIFFKIEVEVADFIIRVLNHSRQDDLFSKISCLFTEFIYRGCFTTLRSYCACWFVNAISYSLSSWNIRFSGQLMLHKTSLRTCKWDHWNRQPPRASYLFTKSKKDRCASNKRGKRCKQKKTGMLQTKSNKKTKN